MNPKSYISKTHFLKHLKHYFEAFINKENDFPHSKVEIIIIYIYLSVLYSSWWVWGKFQFRLAISSVVNCDKNRAKS
jgi:hypothetical protein